MVGSEIGGRHRQDCRLRHALFTQWRPAKSRRQAGESRRVSSRIWRAENLDQGLSAAQRAEGAEREQGQVSRGQFEIVAKHDRSWSAGALRIYDFAIYDLREERWTEG